ncbi:MAG TPA: cyclic nucleotide-binding domain-containing protein [Acidimicrobiales bacterium]|nr:cyclic nucleotide-binding domain-containing protein [Acidimicrobiales bacterium]
MRLSLPRRPPSPVASSPRVGPTGVVPLLRELDIFADLPDEELASLAEDLELGTAHPGQTLETQDEPVHRWSLIADGHAVITRDSTPIGLLGRGDSWNEYSLLNQQRSSIGVVALSPVTLLTLDQRRFFAVPEHHPLLAGRLVARSATSADRMAQPVFNALIRLSRSSA